MGVAVDGDVVGGSEILGLAEAGELGRWTKEEEVDYVADKLINVVTRLREMSPLYELAKEGVDLSTMQWEVH